MALDVYVLSTTGPPWFTQNGLVQWCNNPASINKTQKRRVPRANTESSKVIEILLPVTFYFNTSTRLDNVRNLWRFVINVPRVGGVVGRKITQASRASQPILLNIPTPKIILGTENYFLGLIATNELANATHNHENLQLWWHIGMSIKMRNTLR